MRYVPMLLAEEGMCLAYDVFDSMGRTLVSRNSLLTSSYIDKLVNMGIDGVYIEDKLSEGIDIKPVISPRLRAEGLSSVRNRDVDACKNIAKRIVEEMLKNGNCSLDLVDLRSFDDYTFAHSVNVATVSCAIGLGLELSEEDLVNVVLAGLLHDLGKLDIPSEILNKPERLTREEYMLMKTHAALSYDYIKERIDISAQVKQAVLYHHENMDGSGYPTGASGDELSFLTRILHVADVYDALVSKRPYKKPYSQWEALEFLKGGKGTLFAEEMVDALCKYVPFYPKGSFVTISDGREAIVIDNTGERNTRQLLRLLDGTDIDLLDKKNSDTKIIDPSDESSITMEESEQARASMVKELKRCRISLIDSSQTTYEFVKDKLSYLYDIDWHRSMNVAIGLANKNGMPDLFIFDEDDKNVDGFEEIEKLTKATNGEVPVIVVSSSKDMQKVLKYRDLKISRYVLKPFTVVYIRSELRNLLHDLGDITE